MQTDILWLSILVFTVALMWIPYILERIQRAGFATAMGYSDKIHQNVAPWAARCKLAHRNALEGLLTFVLLVMFAMHMKQSVMWPIQFYFWARLVHYVCQTFGIPYLRTLAWLVMLIAQIYVAAIIFNLF